jgi:hypothetical protein
VSPDAENVVFGDAAGDQVDVGGEDRELVGSSAAMIVRAWGEL